MAKGWTTWSRSLLPPDAYESEDGQVPGVGEMIDLVVASENAGCTL
jgi:hypothetical protein